ncbi:hypothetical protein ACFORL_05375 [Legionella dresdenensis]|uniref:Dot/Icm T4SS effector n=1 Tax=Legionella dresdenensis TaxID=450200 RepID=A0ABV8CED1_9GAMM
MGKIKIDDQRIFSNLFHQELIKLCEETINNYKTINNSYHYTISFTHNHGIAGRQRATELLGQIHKTTSTPRLITDLLTFLQNPDNGNLDKHSLRPMLLDSLHKKFEISGYDYFEGESRCDFGSRLKVIARLCNCPELITTDKLSNSLLDKLASSCSFG